MAFDEVQEAYDQAGSVAEQRLMHLVEAALRSPSGPLPFTFVIITFDRMDGTRGSDIAFLDQHHESITPDRGTPMMEVFDFIGQWGTIFPLLDYDVVAQIKPDGSFAYEEMGEREPAFTHLLTEISGRIGA